MYKEIHPLFLDTIGLQRVLMHETGCQEKDFYKECSPRVIDLACIRQLVPNIAYDNSIELTRIKISDDHTEDILVSKQEGEEIKGILLSNSDSSRNELAVELSRLTGSIRNLYELLRARLR